MTIVTVCYNYSMHNLVDECMYVYVCVYMLTYICRAYNILRLQCICNIYVINFVCILTCIHKCAYKDVMLVNKLAEEYWGQKFGLSNYLLGQLKHVFDKHGSN